MIFTRLKMYRKLKFKLNLQVFVVLFFIHGFVISCSNANAPEIDIEATVQARIDEEIANQELIAMQKAEIAKSVQATVQAVNEEKRLSLVTPSPTPNIQNANIKSGNSNSKFPTNISVLSLNSVCLFSDSSFSVNISISKSINFDASLTF